MPSHEIKNFVTSAYADLYLSSQFNKKITLKNIHIVEIKREANLRFNIGFKHSCLTISDNPDNRVF